MPKRSYSKGAKKALAAMKKRYGAKKGTSVFYAKARKYGGKGSAAKAANRTYAKGRKLRRRKKG